MPLPPSNVKALVLAALMSSTGGCSCDGPGLEDTVGEPGVESGLDSPADSAPDTGPDPVAFVSDISAELDETYASLVLVGWQQHVTASSWVEYSVAGGPWEQTPAVERPAGAAEQWVLGVPYATAVQLRVVGLPDQSTVTSEPLELTTGALYEWAPLPELQGAVDGAYDSASPYLLTSINFDTARGSLVLILDRLGRVVWAHRIELDYMSSLPMVSIDGQSMLLDHSSFWTKFDLGAASHIERIRIDGTVEATYTTPGYMQSYTELPDGRVAWGADPPLESIKAVAADGSPEILWDCEGFLAQVGSSGQDCSSNFLHYDLASGRFLYSLYSIETVVLLQGDPVGTSHWFGHAEGSWDFEPEEAAFWWQHGPVFTADGTLLLSTHTVDDSDVTVAREYALDEERQRLVQLAVFGSDEGIESKAHGGVHRFAAGNTLHHLGDTPRIREFDQDGAVVWELAWAADGVKLGQVSTLADLYPLAPDQGAR